MTKFALILVAWYTLTSEPGNWRYTQFFGWFDTLGQCEEKAQEEASVAETFSDPLGTFQRKMPIQKMTYTCVSAEELRIYLKEKENVN